jgi:Tfp pilus assembly protein PilW
VVQIFLSSKQAFSTVSGASETLDNGRLALHFISSSVSKAGYWGDVNFIRGYGSDETLTVSQTAGTNAPYSDTYTGRFAINTYIFGLNNDSSDAGVVDETDQFFVRFNGHDFNPMSTCAGDAVNASSIAVERYYISVANGSEKTPSLVCETTILNIDQLTGNISVPVAPEIKTQVLISGIENMQILYGQRNLDRTAVRYYTAQDVTDWDLVESLRVALLTTSADEVNTATKVSGYNLLDVKTSAPTDKRARKVFEQTVAMRNVNYDDSE